VNSKILPLDRGIRIIAFLTLVLSFASIVATFPVYNVSTALFRGGISNAQIVTINYVLPNTPAAIAGFLPGDKIISVNGKKITTSDDFISVTHTNVGKVVIINVSRNGSSQTITVTPRKSYPQGEGPIGVTISSQTEVTKKESPWIIVPQAIIRSYLGYEEKFAPALIQSNNPFRTVNMLSHQSVPIYDKSLTRLRELITGIIYLCIGIGLWKFNRWAWFGYILYSCYQIIAMISGLILFFGTHQNLSTQMVEILIFVITIVIQFFAVFYVYSRKKYFL
jgi:membrane-associated protease RseP (regulator of RpoE activity)